MGKHCVLGTGEQARDMRLMRVEHSTHPAGHPAQQCRQCVSVSGADLAAAKEQSRAANWNDCRPNGINPSRIVSGSGVGCVMSAMTRMREPKLPCSCHARPAPICVSNDCGPCSQFESPSNTLSLSLTRPSLCPLGGFSFSFSVRTCSHLMTS